MTAIGICYLTHPVEPRDPDITGIPDEGESLPPGASSSSHQEDPDHVSLEAQLSSLKVSVDPSGECNEIASADPKDEPASSVESRPNSPITDKDTSVASEDAPLTPVKDCLESPTTDEDTSSADSKDGPVTSVTPAKDYSESSVADEDTSSVDSEDGPSTPVKDCPDSPVTPITPIADNGTPSPDRKNSPIPPETPTPVAKPVSRVVNEYFEIRPSPRGGLGSFALKDLKYGEHILLEYPLILTCYETLARDFDALDERRQAALLSLHPYHPDQRTAILGQIWNANA